MKIAQAVACHIDATGLDNGGSVDDIAKITPGIHRLYHRYAAWKVSKMIRLEIARGRQSGYLLAQFLPTLNYRAEAPGRRLIGVH